MIDTSKFKETLEKQRISLEESVAYLKKSDPSLDENAIDSGGTLDDDITEIEGHDRITATKLQMKQELAEVDAALKRIEDGHYGLCKVGGEEISEERLEAIPTATVCLNHVSERR